MTWSHIAWIQGTRGEAKQSSIYEAVAGIIGTWKKNPPPIGPPGRTQPTPAITANFTLSLANGCKMLAMERSPDQALPSRKRNTTGPH